MDEETKGWIDLLDARIAELEEAREQDDAEDKHDDNMRVSRAVLWFVVVETIVTIASLAWAIYITVHHG